MSGFGLAFSCSLTLRAQAKHLNSVRIHGVSITLCDLSNPTFIRWLDLNRATAVLTHQMVVMFIILANAKHLLAAKAYRIRRTGGRERVQSPIDRSESDDHSRIIHLPMQFLCGHEITITAQTLQYGILLPRMTCDEIILCHE